MWQNKDRGKELLWKVLESEAVWNGFSESYEKAAERAYAIISDYLGNSGK